VPMLHIVAHGISIAIVVLLCNGFGALMMKLQETSLLSLGVRDW
jgi:hypothetical protein